MSQDLGKGGRERTMTVPDILRCPCGFTIAPSAYELEWPDASVDTSQIVELNNPQHQEFSYRCVECGRFILNRYPLHIE